MKFVSNVNADNGKIEVNKPIVLHCDIKPENIMITKHGKELVLIDFGRIQELMDSRTYQHYSNKYDMTFTADYSDSQWQDIGKDNFYSYGTVGYSAPECYARAKKCVYPFKLQESSVKNGCVSIESDIFGFGTTFWECLSIYEIGMKALDNASDVTDPSFFNKAIMKYYEQNIHNGEVRIIVTVTSEILTGHITNH